MISGVFLARTTPWLQAVWQSMSVVGLSLGTLFLAYSLTPSLLPRPVVFQGVVSGLSLAAGYALGVCGVGLWSYLELPLLDPRRHRRLTQAATAVSVTIAIVFLWQASEWQNSVRRLMLLPDEDGVRPLSVAAIVGLVFGALAGVAWAFKRTFTYLSVRLRHVFPRRVANVLGAVAAVAVFWVVAEGVFFRTALGLADSISQQVDGAIPPEAAPPAEAARTGSTASLIAWEDLGHQGRAFVSSGPTADQLHAFFGEPTLTPLRVYVGLNAADTPEARAQLALRELQRVGGFKRSVLLLVTPTGTGWVDPAALTPVEYLHRGNIASVAMQYSYLPSVLALPTDGAYGAESARALFRAVYGHWTQLPRETRPKLYLYGVSLGALNAERSFDAYDIVADPFQGALLTGLPFRSALWQTIVDGRTPGSPAWLPRYREGSVIRFMNQDGGLERGDAEWGPFRIAVLQYASDPMTFFSTSTLYRRPAWLAEPRARDVSSALRWYPVVTTLQLAADMAVANTAPAGFGHNFAGVHYASAWLALMEPAGWSPPDIERLNDLLSSRDLDTAR
ncbi:MAG: alpha/beta-hydrolase family protein [Acidobacteriota bacterium]|nr:alpha/beta-hydrolase family protein [Acidobacteriota bacterium]